MSYVLANTRPMFGNRAQALRPLRMSGWYNGPYPVYGQPASVNLNGEFNPETPPTDPSWQGMRMYRIDPQTGQYRFYDNAIRPRGIFRQNTFQSPQLSSLGLPIANSPAGYARRQASTLMLPAPHPSGLRKMQRMRSLSGCSATCHCGGRCQSQKRLGRLGRLGAPGDACTVDSDCGGGFCDQASFTCQAGPPPPGGDNPISPQAQPQSQTQSILQAIQKASQAGAQIANAAAGVSQQPPPPPRPSPCIGTGTGIFSGTTMIGSYCIPNSVLWAGAALIAASAIGGGRRR